MARIFERFEGQAEYKSGVQGRVALSRDYHMQYLLVKLSLVHDNAANADFKDEEIFSIINNIEVVANGNQNLKQIPASKLYINNIVSSSMRGLNNIVKTEGADRNSYVFAMIPFSYPNTIRSHDTILNTRLFSTFELIVNWGSDATIGTGVTVKSGKLEVYSNSLINYTGEHSQAVTYFKETALNKDVTSSANEFEIELPVYKMYKSLSIVSTVDGKRVNSVINHIRIKSGTTTFVDLPAEVLRAENVFQYSPESVDLLKGIHVVDFMQRGRNKDALNTISEFRTLQVVLSVTKQSGTNKIEIFSDTLETVNKK